MIKLATVSALAVFGCSLFSSIEAAESDKHAYLPPIIKWQGKSESLIKDSNHPWITPSEKTDLQDTPSYLETMAFMNKLVASDKRLNKVSLGKSPQGRDIWMVIATKEGHKSADTMHKQGKPTFLVQAGIHSGEIDGKDAGFMLMRDIIHGEKGHLLNDVNWLFVPILSVDGHERTSPFNRVNQRGPKQMGWRTNMQNLNLNRDYAKLDTPELQHMIRAINVWQPDLYYDVHVTDGEDYQYDITYGYNLPHADSPNISKWMSENLQPSIDKALSENGHLGGPLTFGWDRMEFSKGLAGWTASPRYSNGYGDARHLATVLVENHSLKPYKQRVLGTYVMLEETLKLLAQKGDGLKAATKKDQQNRHESQIVSWSYNQEQPELMDYAGIEYKKAKDNLMNLDYIQWLGKAKTYKDLPIFWANIPNVEVKIAKNYWVPPQYLDVIERLEIHGIKYQRIDKAQQISATQLVASEHKFAENPFEGHHMPRAKFIEKQVTQMMPEGSIKISTDQALRNLIVALLDARAPDSFFSWGFFNQMFQRTEYIESYAMVPLAKKMVADNPQLKQAFLEKKKADKKFAEDPRAQMRWFYERSKYYDQSYLKYPVLLEY